MSQDRTLKTSISGKNWVISIKLCSKVRDGQFIRELTKENCYDYLNKTIGWNENRHLQEPKFPERYLMLFDRDNYIGFLSFREQANYLYLETLQLIKSYRRQGIGTRLLSFIEDIAREKSKDKIRLRVINGNPAQSLYRRNGFKLVEDEKWCLLMEKVLKTRSHFSD